MKADKPIYTPEEAGSGQWGVCAKCGLGPTAEGHDGCLGTLPDSVMNACCGHGNDRQAYVQFWGGDDVEGADAVALQAKMIANREVKHDNQ